MKNLSEQELLDCLHAKRKSHLISYEELTHPNYAVWGRARELSYFQALCLVSRLVPLMPPFLKLLLDSKTDLAIIEWHQYYPASSTDINRLKNFDILLKKLPLQQADSITPKEFIALCKKHPDVTAHLPDEFVRIVEDIGPHPSLSLPNFFTALEINPHALRTVESLEKLAKAPQVFTASSKEEAHPSPAIPPAPKETPLGIAKKLFPLEHIDHWRKADVLSSTEILLLHYRVDPHICHVHPTEPSNEPRCKELADYLNLYFLGNQQLFLNQLDENGLINLMERSLTAGTLHTVRGNKFAVAVIVTWMNAKNLSFPLVEEKSKAPKAAVLLDEICKIDFNPFTPDQQLKLVARILATAIWKQDKSLPLKEVAHHEASVALCKLWAKFHNCPECAPRTYEDYIRDVNPNYKSRK